VSDIDTEAVDSLKVLDPNRPIREADMRRTLGDAGSYIADPAVDLHGPNGRQSRKTAPKTAVI
jgi:hypothetical protein